MQLGFDFDKPFELKSDQTPVGLPSLFVESKTSIRSVYCSICGTYFQESTYLKSVIDDIRVLWIANMITHYRHNHITSWNKCWGYGGGRYRSGWFGNYETEKQKVNERAKRQIIRKSQAFLKLHKITSSHFAQLQHNDEETLSLAKVLLG